MRVRVTGVVKEGHCVAPGEVEPRCYRHDFRRYNMSPMITQLK